MTIKYLLPIITATLLCSGTATVQARQPKNFISTRKPKVTQPVQPKWQVFTAPDGRFTVLMPGVPQKNSQVQKTHMGEINLQSFIAQPPKQEVAYVVSYNEFPYSYGQLANPQKVLNDARDLALKTTRSNLIKQRNFQSANGHTAKEIVYVNSGGKITRTRMLFAHGRLYQVTAMTSKKQHKTLTKTITGYLNSFQVVLKP